MTIPVEPTPPLRVATRAIIADDERLLREQLQARLRESWPDLDICGVARDGLEAVKLADELRPDVVFLDIRMPGLTGIEAAREIVGLDDWCGEIVFVTAYDEYAVTAFEQGAVDYLLKPVETSRLDKTVSRLRERLANRQLTREESRFKAAGHSPSPSAQAPLQPLFSAPEAANAQDALLQTLAQLQQRLQAEKAAPLLRWLQCSVGATTKLICVDDVLFFRSDEKYTRIQLLDQEAFIRTPIRELICQLDAQQFWQIHRSTIVNLSAIAAVQRDEMGRQRVSLKRHKEVLEVSRSFGHVFKHQ